MTSGASSKRTKFVTNLILATGLGAIPATGFAAGPRELLKEAARRNGFAPTASTHIKVDPKLVAIGRQFFDSKALSLNGNISCRSCHLDRFSSADGIPNAVGVGGVGEGKARVHSQGRIIPRNTLPLWGRGGRAFSVFFWDGKVDFSNDRRISQFGDKPPSLDPLVTTIHLPPIEIREMLVEDQRIAREKTETVKSAARLYAQILKRLRKKEAKAMEQLARVRGKGIADVTFLDVAQSVAAFIRNEFRIKPTRFHRFVFGKGSLTDDEVAGGIIFYGKGQCATCHSGAYFSDQSFHSIPFPQLGFGKNGFGVDYGRFNVTHDPKSLYKFRTPPLFNVTKTAPYGHSGSVRSLRNAIVYHFDPLRLAPLAKMSKHERHQYYQQLMAASADANLFTHLSRQDVEVLVKFLETLEF